LVFVVVYIFSPFFGWLVCIYHDIASLIGLTHV